MMMLLRAANQATRGLRSIPFVGRRFEFWLSVVSVRSRGSLVINDFYLEQISVGGRLSVCVRVRRSRIMGRCVCIQYRARDPYGWGSSNGVVDRPHQTSVFALLAVAWGVTVHSFSRNERTS